MRRRITNPFLIIVILFTFVSLACVALQPALTSAPIPTSTQTIAPTATNTLRPSPTLRPTRTPNVAATQHIEQLSAEVQSYYEKGYLATTNGSFTEVEDFSYDWARLGAYKVLFQIGSASDFFLSAHFKWNSAYQNSDTSGCGFIFGLQPNNDHYAVFLDRMTVEFRIRNLALGYSTRIKPIRGSGLVKFDYPAEADFTLIVKGDHAYVLVNGEVVSEYLLPGEPLRGDVGLSVLSGTNKDYGTHCEMSHLHLWTPNE